MKNLILLLTIQFKSSIRVPESLFYSIFFPVALFVIMGYTFNIDETYIYFFLTGMISIIFLGESINGIGPIIIKYYEMGFVKYFKSYPISVPLFFSSFIITRCLVAFFTSSLIIIISIMLFDLNLHALSVFNIIMGVILIIISYSLIGIILSIMFLESNKSVIFSSSLYFGSMFLTEAYFPISNEIVFLGWLFPLKPMLNYMRNQQIFDLIISISWVVLLFVIFIYVLKNKKNKRLV